MIQGAKAVNNANLPDRWREILTERCEDRQVEQIAKRSPQFGLQAMFLSLVHTARQVMGVGSTRSRFANPQAKRLPTVSPMTGTKNLSE